MSRLSRTPRNLSRPLTVAVLPGEIAIVISEDEAKALWDMLDSAALGTEMRQRLWDEVRVGLDELLYSEDDDE